MSAITLRDATLAPGGRAVLHGLTLDVPEGAFVGVLGPNGAGKTTLFRAILGLLPPTTGSVQVGSRAASGQDTGYMPQLGALPPGTRLRGDAFVASAVRGGRWGLPLLTGADRRDVVRVLDLVDGAALAQRPLGSLSGGERQRLMLAQALLGKPRLLLLDEPLQGLDPRRQADIVALVARLHRTLGLTVLFSAHDLNPLLGAMDQVLYLGGGHAALGTVEAVVTSPVLSRLYGVPVEVVRAGGRILVLSDAGHAMEGPCCPPGAAFVPV